METRGIPFYDGSLSLGLDGGVKSFILDVAR